MGFIAVLQCLFRPSSEVRKEMNGALPCNGRETPSFPGRQLSDGENQIFHLHVTLASNSWWLQKWAGKWLFTSLGQHTQNQIFYFSPSNSAFLYGTVLSEWPHYHPVSQARILAPILIFIFLITFLTGHTQSLLKHLLNIFISQFSLLLLSSSILIFFGYFSACLTWIPWWLRW